MNCNYISWHSYRTLSSSLPNLGKPLCIQALPWQTEGMSGNLSLPPVPNPALTLGMVWFCSSRGFLFSDRILSRQQWWMYLNWMGLPSSPCLTQLGCVLWQSLAFNLNSHLPPVLLESSGVPGEANPVPALSLPPGQTAGCFLYLCHFSSNGMVVRPSPTSQGGWHLNCSLRVKDSFGFLWYFISRG